MADVSAGDPKALLLELQQAEAKSRTEEDLRIRVEHALKDAVPDLPDPYYEQSIRTATYQGRADAIHTRLVIEYEPPRKLKGALAAPPVQPVLLQMQPFNQMAGKALRVLKLVDLDASWRNRLDYTHSQTANLMAKPVNK